VEERGDGVKECWSARVMEQKGAGLSCTRVPTREPHHAVVTEEEGAGRAVWIERALLAADRRPQVLVRFAPLKYLYKGSDITIHA
jgi:hypothetical protein